MIPMEIRKIVVADYDEGRKVESISRVVRVSTSAIYRLLKKRQKTGTIEPSYEKSGRQSEVTAEKLAKRKPCTCPSKSRRSAISFATSYGWDIIGNYLLMLLQNEDLFSNSPDSLSTRESHLDFM